jgi:hypothetical protein
MATQGFAFDGAPVSPDTAIPPVSPDTATTPALADDDVFALMIASLYDRDCEKIPGIDQLVKLMLEQIPASAVNAGIEEARKVHQGMPTIKFCSLYKADIDRAMRH